MTCPFMGLIDDPKTVLDFPSDGNSCYRVKKVGPIRITHQTEYCLTDKHLECPIFLSDGKLILPNALRERGIKKTVNKRVKVAIVTVVILILGISALVLTNRSNEQTEQTRSSGGGLIPLTGASGLASTEAARKAGREDGQPGGLELNSTSCVPPPNWVVYVIKPTDSLVRLSLIFGVTVPQLQRVNCLGDRVLVRPGEEIFVPGPTSTPSTTITLTPQPFIPRMITPTAPLEQPPPPPANQTLTATVLSPTLPATTTNPLPSITANPLPSTTLPSTLAPSATPLIPTFTLTVGPPTATISLTNTPQPTRAHPTQSRRRTDRP